jgi:hypothetical protein
MESTTPLSVQSGLRKYLLWVTFYPSLHSLQVSLNVTRYPLCKSKLWEGGGILASSNGNGNVNLGQDIITAGLGIQVLFFGFFIIVGGMFHYRLKRSPTTRSQSPDIPWKRYMWALYIASICILIRSVFRVVEYVMGQSGYLLSHEIFLYIFDATLMLLAMAIYNLLHPSKIIYKPRHSDARCLESQDSGYALDGQVQERPKP